MARDDGWGSRAVRERCERFRATLADRPDLVSAEELADYWPGGRENRVPGRGAWIYCYGAYLAFLWRMRDDEATTEADQAAAEQLILDALRGAPTPVQLVALGADGSPQYVDVHPKSFDALMHMQARDSLVGWLAPRVAVLREQPGVEARDLAQRGLLELSYQQQVLAWIVTHPGPGIPYPESERVPAVPPAIAALDVMDFYRIQRAHWEVNGRRLHAVTKLLAPALGGEASGRSSWAVLAGAAASELGTHAKTLMRDWTLESWLAQLHLTAAAKRPPTTTPASIPGEGVFGGA